ncbi:MAG TPA: hypothetical protein VF613_09610, partial [Longimicrobium sp.]
MQGRLARMVAEVHPTDVSTLIALRALVARDHGVNDVERAEWLTRMREEYRRWYGPGRGHTEAHAELGSFSDGETERYLEEQVVSRLRADEVIELLGFDGEPLREGKWAALRLTPWVLQEIGEERPQALALMDYHIGAILGRQEDESVLAQAAMVTEDATEEEIQADQLAQVAAGEEIQSG